MQYNSNAKPSWKARTFVSRSYQIKDNTVYYKLYFGMIWHQDNMWPPGHYFDSIELEYTGKSKFEKTVCIFTVD